MRAPKHCAEPDCYNLTRSTRCDEHTRSGWSRTPRTASSTRTGTRAWRRRRAEVLNRDGHQCVIRGPRCTIHATEVDHVIPCHLGGGDSMANLQSACHNCHQHRTTTQAGAARG